MIRHLPSNYAEIWVALDDDPGLTILHVVREDDDWRWGKTLSDRFEERYRRMIPGQIIAGRGHHEVRIDAPIDAQMIPWIQESVLTRLHRRNF